MGLNQPIAYQIRCAEVLPRHLSLLELEPDDCRYPYGEGPITFCGRAKRENSSYCPAHFDLTRKTAVAQ